MAITINHDTNDISATSGNVTINGSSVGSGVTVRNRIINGAMGIDQRNGGSAQTITAGAALEYTVDRWYAYCTGANVTGQRVAGTGSNQFVYRFTGAASVTGIGFGQRIEAVNCYDLVGSTATLSVELANSLLTTVTWTAYYANTTDTFGTLASPTRTQIATGTFTVNTTLTKYNTTISIPGAATTGIEIVFTVAGQTSGTWTITNIQLAAGSTSTEFERRLLGQELVLCQRYTQVFKGAGAGNNYLRIGFGLGSSSTTVLIQIVFKATMRNPPAVIVNSSSNFAVFDGASVTSCTTVAQDPATSSDNALLACSVASGIVVSRPYELVANNTSAEILIFSSEL